MALNLLAGLALGMLIGGAAFRLRALTRSGAVAAALTGGLIFGLGGLPWAALLLTFFISSSGLSRMFSRRKQQAEEKYAKGSQRDMGQVLANGGLGAALVIIHACLPLAAWPWLAFAGAMAAVNADTWATELGVFNRGLPRLVTTGKPVERGTSGGVSLLGYLAALGGAGLVGLAAAVFGPSSAVGPTVLAASLAGLAGSTVDSLLGATVQALFWCPACQKETERYPLHGCGSSTTPLRGWRWMSNDMVNLACSLVGAVCAAILGSWLLG